jgi:hypothetical protein
MQQGSRSLQLATGNSHYTSHTRLLPSICLVARMHLLISLVDSSQCATVNIHTCLHNPCAFALLQSLHSQQCLCTVNGYKYVKLSTRPNRRSSPSHQAIEANKDDANSLEFLPPCINQSVMANTQKVAGQGSQTPRCMMLTSVMQEGEDCGRTNAGNVPPRGGQACMVCYMYSTLLVSCRHGYCDEDPLGFCPCT